MNYFHGMDASKEDGAVGTSKYAIFAKSVELGSLTRAAEECGCTQSGVSHAVSALEEELGFPLMIRSRAGVRLTPDGERVFPAIRGICAALDELNRQAEAIRGVDAGTVRVGAFTSVAVHWLPGMIKAFEQAHPQIHFELINGDYHDVSEAFLQSRIDMGFVALPADLPNCTCEPLVEDRLLVVLPKNHPLAHCEAFPVAEIGREPFISLLESSNHDARRALELAGVRANVKFKTKDDYAIIAMVEQGLGISIMPELLLQGHDSNVCAIPLENGATRTIGLAVANASRGDLCVRLFAEHIRNWLKSRVQCA